MSGFAFLSQPGSTEPERHKDFYSLLELTAGFKQLPLPGAQASGGFCTAAKLDSPSSIHRGIFVDPKTGSWMLAVGSVVLLQGENHSEKNLLPLLQGYLEIGSQALQQWDGHFGLIIYDTRDGSVSIISDPMGCFAIYYAANGKQFISSTSALAVARLTGSRPDPLTIECFLRSGRPYGENTLWQGVKRLRPATVLKISAGQCTEHEYWSLSIDERIAKQPLEDTLEQAEEIIFRIFKQIFSRDEKVWGALTGGMDSRLVLMYMAQLGIPFEAYTVGTEHHPDVEVARYISREMGWSYQWMPLPQDWAQAQTAWFEKALWKGDASINVFQLAGVLQGQTQRSATSLVNVSGSGVDEWRYACFGASIIFPRRNTAVDCDKIFDANLLNSIPLHTMKQDRTAEVRGSLKEYFNLLTAKYRGYDNAVQSDIIFRRYRHPIHGGAYLSADAGTIRTLIPFCFKELENFGISLNHWWRIKYHSGFVRSLLEKGDPRLANIKTVHGEPGAPLRLTNLYKFTPLGMHLASHMTNKVGVKLTGKKVLSAPNQTHPADHSASAWKTAWLDWAISEKLLDPSQMASGTLYNGTELLALVAQSRTGTVDPGEFLDRVITVEMALRVTGASTH